MRGDIKTLGEIPQRPPRRVARRQKFKELRSLNMNVEIYPEMIPKYDTSYPSILSLSIHLSFQKRSLQRRNFLKITPRNGRKTGVSMKVTVTVQRSV